jgi:hypothetical protein
MKPRKKLLPSWFLYYSLSGKPTVATVPPNFTARLATLWRLIIEVWLRRQGLISVRQNQNPKVSTNFLENWSHN